MQPGKDIVEGLRGWDDVEWRGHCSSFLIMMVMIMVMRKVMVLLVVLLVMMMMMSSLKVGNPKFRSSKLPLCVRLLLNIIVVIVIITIIIIDITNILMISIIPVLIENPYHHHKTSLTAPLVGCCPLI